MTRSSARRDEEARLAAVLAQLRVEAGVSQRRLAAALGRTQSHVHMLETGQRRLQLRDFYLLCRILEVDPVSAFAKASAALDALRLPPAGPQASANVQLDSRSRT